MGAATRGQTLSTRVVALARRRPLSHSLVGFAFVVGVANLLVLLGQARSLIYGLYLDADNSTAFVLPALASHVPAGSVVNLGNHAWYEPWWFMRATVGLPGYRQLWEAAPFVWNLIGIAVVTACAWWALGRLAALLSTVVLLAASEAMRAVVYVPESHGLIVLHAGVLCGALLFVYRRSLSERLTRRALFLAGIPLVIFTGAGLTDQLLLVGGMASFILAPLACWLRFRSRASLAVSAFAVVTGVLSVPVALLFSHVMRDQHVVHAAFPITFVGSGTLSTSLENLISAFASLGGGAFFGASASGTNLFTFAAGALTFLALAAVLRALWRWASSTTNAKDTSSPQAGSRQLFVAFWGTTLVLGLAVFALTSLSASAVNYRYLLGSWVALAALLGILGTTALARAFVILAVAGFGVLNLRAELANGVGTFGVGPSLPIAETISRFARAHGASIGYTAFWDAAPVTWETHLRVKAYPIEACAAPSGWCKFGIQISTWYVPRANTSTFLITDTRPGVPGEVGSPPPGFGAPIAQAGVGQGFTVYIYNHDVAAMIG
jgi:hypothetical protein